MRVCLQDGIVTCFVSGVRTHDARLHRESTVEAQLSTLFITDAAGIANAFRPAMVLGDLAHPNTVHCVRQRSQAALAAWRGSAVRVEE